MSWRAGQRCLRSRLATSLRVSPRPELRLPEPRKSAAIELLNLRYVKLSSENAPSPHRRARQLRLGPYPLFPISNLAMARFKIARLGEGKEMAMETATVRGPDSAPDKPTRRAEILAFLILAILIWPVVAVGIVGGYGFLIWMSQLVLGPPGPPGSPH